MSNVCGNLCRICLTTKESFNYFLFNNVSAETFSFCTSIPVKKEEDLPKAFCDACFELLTKYTEFKQKCIDSQNTLINNKTIKAEVEPYSEVSLYKNCEVEHSFAPKSEDIKEEILTNDIGEDFVSSDLDYINQPACNVLKKKKAKMESIKKATKDGTDHIQEEFQNTCELCGKVFKYFKRLVAHKKTHFMNIDDDDNQADLDFNPSHQCKKCNKSFISVSGLYRHEVNTHTTVSLSSVSCTTCGRVYASKYSLREHEKIHVAKNIHVCHICGKKMSTEVVLKTHLETHTVREREHTCEHCGRKYFNSRNLLAHIARIHSGTKFICGYCGYTFNDKYNLTKHILNHDGKKLFKCDICDKPFGSSGTLKEHKRIHSGERPYSCIYCPKRFLANRRLQDHQKTHTGEKPHKCSICGQRFIQRGSLKRHLQVHDPIRLASGGTTLKS